KPVPLTAAWLLTYFLLLFLRAKLPDVFRYGHETLFLTPLVCLASGECLAWLWHRGGWRRALALGCLLLLIGQGAVWQWRAVADQRGNALWGSLPVHRLLLALRRWRCYASEVETEIHFQVHRFRGGPAGGGLRPHAVGPGVGREPRRR